MNKKIISQCLLAAGILSAVSFAHADEGRGFYVGGFAGAGRSGNQDVEQTGTAHKFGDTGYSYGGSKYDFNLAVDVKGNAKRDTSGLGGVHVGYEWATTSWGVKPALELEAYYVGADQNSNLANPNDEVVTLKSTAPSAYDNSTDTNYTTHTTAYDYTGGPNQTKFQDAIQNYANGHYGAGEHRFQDHMKMNAGIFMANMVFTYDTGSMFKPYVGGGLGFAVINMNSASSFQTSPSANPNFEMSGGVNGTPVNHFNSNTSAYDVGFASQVKLGLRADLDKNWSAFVEYRYLHINSTEYTFGSTVYPDHSATDNWNYKSGSMDFNNALAGVEYAF